MDLSNTDPADKPAHSDSDLACIADLVIWNQMPYLSACTLTGLNSERWPVWLPYNIQRISEARREDSTRDWYFPIFFQDALPALLTTSNTQSSWCGIHHLSGAAIHPRPLLLPPLGHLPPEWINSSHIDVVASSGGLLLIRLKPCICTPTSILQSHWERLFTCNPLRKEWRELPAADCGDLMISSWDYCRVQAHMVVDDAGNSYKVILTFTNFLCVYKSASNSWACRSFPRSGPWGYRKLDRSFAWGYVSASAYVGGHLYIADLEVDRVANAPIVRVFEIDEQAATWRQHIRFPIQRQDFLQSPSVFHNICSQIKIDRCLEMVECMGGMYVVIAVMSPAMSIVMDDDFEVMPLEFHVYGLHGAGHAHGILKIRVPRAAGDTQIRRAPILAMSSRNDDLYFRNWFRCIASGSVIWVSFEDYLLQYDVVTRQSKMLIIPETLQFGSTAQFAYRPSFHMKP